MDSAPRTDHGDTDPGGAGHRNRDRDGDPVWVIATAGHVDHGKSTLVRALTGTDPDRWAEERVRGLTIDLGFASRALPSGEVVAFVDVPGHTRFLRNALAGLGGIAGCCLVVDTREGWRAQSEEHLRILELLGVPDGVVALSKASGCTPTTVARVAEEVRTRVAGTFLAPAPVVVTDAISGRGLDDLIGALERLVAGLPPPLDADRPRLWIDRSFSVRGAGTVVTGTLTGGALAVGDRIDVVLGAATHPEVRAVRVRGLQALHTAVDRVPPGSRAAVNLAGVGHDEIGRGDVLVHADRWHLSTTADVELVALPHLGHAVTRRGAHVAHIGAGEHSITLQLLGDVDALAPGGRGPARLRWARPLPLVPGDRAVVRDHGRGETVGGAEVLEVDPLLPPRRARPDRDPRRVVAERGWIDADDLTRRTGASIAPTVGRWVVAPTALDARLRQLRAGVDAAGPEGLALARLDDRDRAIVGLLDDVEVVGGWVRQPTTGDRLGAHPFVAAARAAPFQPPDPRSCDPAELAALRRAGLVVSRRGVVFAAEVVDEAAARIGPLLAAHPEGVGVGPLRDALGTSRKYAVPLLELLDAAGVTRRVGDRRVVGRRGTAPPT